MLDSLKTMWEAVSVREELVEVEIFSIKVGVEEDLVSQPRNYKHIMNEF